MDIVNKKLHFVNLSEGPSTHRQLDLDFSIGTTADIEGNDTEILFGGKLGYGIINRETGESRWIAKFWNDDERKSDGGGKPGVGANREERMRSNDGAVDAMGRYYVGTMNDPALVGENFTDEGAYTVYSHMASLLMRPQVSSSAWIRTCHSIVSKTLLLFQMVCPGHWTTSSSTSPIPRPGRS